MGNNQLSKGSGANKTAVYLPTTKNAAFARAIRAKCLDCAENAPNVRDCNICKCPLWPYRFGKSAAAAKSYYEQQGAIIITVDVKKYDYVEQLKGKRG